MNKWTGLRLSTKEMGEAPWARLPVFSDLLKGPAYADLIHPDVPMWRWAW